jgi:hypothetical protein
MTVSAEERARLQELLAEAIVIAVQDLTAPSEWGIRPSAELATIASRISTAIVDACGSGHRGRALHRDHLCLSVTARFDCAEVLEERFAEIGASAARQIFERVAALHEQLDALTLDFGPTTGE